MKWIVCPLLVGALMFGSGAPHASAAHHSSRRAGSTLKKFVSKTRDVAICGVMAASVAGVCWFSLPPIVEATKLTYLGVKSAFVALSDEATYRPQLAEMYGKALYARSTGDLATLKRIGFQLGTMPRSAMGGAYNLSLYGKIADTVQQPNMDGGK